MAWLAIAACSQCQSARPARSSSLVAYESTPDYTAKNRPQCRFYGISFHCRARYPVVTRRPREWVLRMVQILPMSTSLREEMLRYVPRTDDPEIRARQKHVARVLLDMDPELRAEVGNKAHEEGRMVGARAALRRVLARRELSLSPEDEARIEACANLATLERWLDQAIVASSAADALHGEAAP